MRRTCEASVTAEAPIEAVWELVADVTRVGEWSGECRGCTWVDGSGSAIKGARFRGRNRRGGMRWTRTNEVVDVEAPHRLVWRTVPGFPYPDSVEWELRLAEKDGGTLVTESFQVLKIPKLMEWMIGVAMPAHEDRTQDLAEDLGRLKHLVESTGRTDR